MQSTDKPDPSEGAGAPLNAQAFGLPSAEDLRLQKLGRLQQFAAMLEKTPYMAKALEVVREKIAALEGEAPTPPAGPGQG